MYTHTKKNIHSTTAPPMHHTPMQFRFLRRPDAPNNWMIAPHSSEQIQSVTNKQQTKQHHT